jgi:hypothetical protein
MLLSIILIQNNEIVRELNDPLQTQFSNCPNFLKIAFCFWKIRNNNEISAKLLKDTNIK